MVSCGSIGFLDFLGPEFFEYGGKILPFPFQIASTRTTGFGDFFLPSSKTEFQQTATILSCPKIQNQ
jgi:hypothetical protein